MEFKYPKGITEPIERFCEEIEKYYPGILQIKYNQDSMNDWDENVPILKQRMQMGLCTELIKMGMGEKILKKIHEFNGIKDEI